jgi:hypothetical protein
MLPASEAAWARTMPGREPAGAIKKSCLVLSRQLFLFKIEF